MSVTRIASRYAKSLIEIAQEHGKLDAMLADVQNLQEAFKNRDFSLMLKSPIIHADRKHAIIKAIFDGKLDNITMSFIDIIINKGREPYLPEIANEFMVQYRAIKQIASIKITTATPLDEAALAQIKAKLIASNIANDNVEITTKTNPDLLGGYVLEFEDRLYDASIAHKLDLLRKEFGANVYQKQI